MLTVVDIRAVGPGTWTEWKRQLLRALFDAAEERLRLGHKQRGRSDKVADRHAALAAELGWTRAATRAQARRLPDSYWLAEPPEWQLANARQIAVAEARIGDRRWRRSMPSPIRGRARRDCRSSRPTRRGCSIASPPGSPRAGASVVDARIHTTRDGMALDNLLVTDARGQGYADPRHRARLVEAVTKRAGAGRAAAAARGAPVEPRGGVRGRAVGADRRAGLDPHHGGRGQCARPPRAAGAARLCHPRERATRSIRRISRPMASARSTSSTSPAATGGSSTATRSPALRAALDRRRHRLSRKRKGPRRMARPS